MRSTTQQNQRSKSVPELPSDIAVTRLTISRAWQEKWLLTLKLLLSYSTYSVIHQISKMIPYIQKTLGKITSRNTRQTTEYIVIRLVWHEFRKSQTTRYISWNHSLSKETMMSSDTIQKNSLIVLLIWTWHGSTLVNFYISYQYFWNWIDL